MTTVVVGVGIIGTAIAHDLRKRGRQVVLLDHDAPSPCSAVYRAILSASARTKGLFSATGHGHLGLTYATTARQMET